jgi:hypothetical protein
MAIGTYAQLQTAMSAWLDRDLSSQYPDFIALFEAQVNRKLRVRPQITTATITITAGSGTLPTDYLEHKRVTWQGNPTRELTYASPSYLSAINAASVSASPIYFTIEGNTIKVGPLDNTSLVMAYSQKVPALAVTDPNWLLTSHPDGYLFGSLTMAATFTADAENGAVWNDLTQKFLGELWGLDFAQRGQMAQRVVGQTP